MDIQCPYCATTCKRGNMVKHLNLKHIGVMTNDSLHHLGFIIHVPCGEAMTKLGYTRHCHNCVHHVADVQPTAQVGDGVNAIGGIIVPDFAMDAPVAAAAVDDPVVGVGAVLGDVAGDAIGNDVDDAIVEEAIIMNGGGDPVFENDGNDIVAGVTVGDALDDVAGGVFVNDIDDAHAGGGGVPAGGALAGGGVPAGGGGVAPGGVVVVPGNGGHVPAYLADYTDAGVCLKMYIAVAEIPLVPVARLHYAIRDALQTAIQTACDKYLLQHSEENLFRVLCLPKLGVARTIHATRGRLRAIARGDYRSVFHEIGEPTHRDAPAAVVPNGGPLTQKDLKRIDRAISDGYVRKAAAVLRGESAVALPTPAVVAEMREKHPVGPVNPFGNTARIAPPALTDAHLEILDHLVDQLDTQSSPGLSGWSAVLLKRCYGTREANTPFRRFMFCLAKQMFQGTAPGRSMLCGARLTALRQSPTKLRPIACGELFYRVVMRFLLRVSNHATALLAVQRGVGSPGGVSPIVELVQRKYEAMLEGVDEEWEETGYSLDFQNAFNMLSRSALAMSLPPSLVPLVEWAYNNPTPLVMTGGDEIVVIPSSQGVRQGDPLGPLLFSLAIRAKIERLQLLVAPEIDALVVAYLDDVTLFSHRPDLLAAIEDIFRAPPGMAIPPDGLVLNVAKTRVDDFRTLPMSDTGLPVLGSLVGNLAARRQFLETKILKVSAELQRLRQVPSQQALLLLRLCVVPELQHLLRTMDLADLELELRQLDEAIYDTVQFLRLAPARAADEPVDPLVSRIITLPLSLGGLGLFSFRELRPHARAACREEASAQLLLMGVPAVVPVGGGAVVNEPPVRQKDRTKEHFLGARSVFVAGLTADQRMAFMDNSSKTGTAWMHAVPCGRYRSLRDRDVSAALNIRMLKSDACNRPTCRRCELPNTVLHSEACTQSHLPTKSRHDYIRDKVKEVLKSSRWIESEPVVAQQPNLRRADLKIGSAADGLALDPRFGLVDFKVKCVLSQDTVMVRGAVVRAEGETLEHYSYAQIAAALDVAHQQCVASYAALALPQPVVPIVVSSGGTMHRECYAFIKTLVPDAYKRRMLRVDISLALVRARAQAYDMTTVD